MKKSRTNKFYFGYNSIESHHNLKAVIVLHSYQSTKKCILELRELKFSVSI